MPGARALRDCRLRHRGAPPMAGPLAINDHSQEQGGDGQGDAQRTDPDFGEGDFRGQRVRNRARLRAFETKRAFVGMHCREPVDRQGRRAGPGAFAAVDARREVAFDPGRARHPDQCREGSVRTQIAAPEMPYDQRQSQQRAQHHDRRRAGMQEELEQPDVRKPVEGTVQKGPDGSRIEKARLNRRITGGCRWYKRGFGLRGSCAGTGRCRRRLFPPVV